MLHTLFHMRYSDTFQKWRIGFVILSVVLVFLFPFGIISADTAGGSGNIVNNPPSGSSSGGSGNIVNNPPRGTSGDGLDVSVKIENPLSTKIDSIPALIEAILNIVLIIGVPIIALAIIYSGFLFVTAVGNSEKLATAKKALLYTLIGAALLLGSWVLAKAIGETVAEISRTT